jgi:uncharacterized membrane protein YccC
MSQRGTMSMTLFFLTALIVFGDVIYNYMQGRGVQWIGIVIGLALVCLGVYFRTVKRPT